jgi:hypothetical protein
MPASEKGDDGRWKTIMHADYLHLSFFLLATIPSQQCQAQQHQALAASAPTSLMGGSLLIGEP